MSVTIDSTNPRVIADNIRKLDDAVQAAASELPEVTTSDEGSVLTVNSSGEWAKGNPIIGNKDYSTTEQDTGVKWIDEKDIYTIVFEGTTPDGETSSITIPLSFDNIVSMDAYVVLSDQIRNFAGVIAFYANTNGTGIVIARASSASYQDKEFYMIVNYTKPDPVPGNREPDDAPDDAEPELKKVTKKKTTKKEEE